MMICDENVAIEVPFDGWVSLIIGHVVIRADTYIVLDHAAFVKDTGRRSEFFAGRYDGNVEVEPYPDEMRIRVPIANAWIYSWPHPLLREVK